MDWQVGDLAVCVDLGNLCREDQMDRELRLGGIYAVENVFMAQGHLGIIEQGLALKGVKPINPRVIGYAASRFRKIRPDEHEASEPEFVTLLKRTKVSA